MKAAVTAFAVSEWTVRKWLARFRELGQAGKVREIHLTALPNDTLGSVNCRRPKICKRVCFINGQGQPECEDRCVDPD